MGGTITADAIAGQISSSTITNAQLAGSIANVKLANSAITIAGSSTSLGGTITADDIAGQISSSTITNAQLAGSIDLTSKVIGVLPFANGGTGLSSVGSSGQVLSSTGSEMSWVNTTEHGPWTTTTSGIYYDSGNVGIGTTSPNAKLEVVGDISCNSLEVNGTIKTTNIKACNFPEAFTINNWNTQIKFPNSNYGLRGFWDGADRFHMDILFSGSEGYSPRDNQRGFRIIDTTNTTTNDGTRLYVNGDGNVGIGTTSPKNKLDVNGDALIYGNIFGRGGGSNIANLAIGGNDAWNSSALKNNTTGTNNVAVGQNALFLNTTGNFNTGIGGLALGLAGNAGSNNTACGYKAGLNVDVGQNNTFIGYETGPNLLRNLTNVTCIGNGAGWGTITGSTQNEIILGNGSIQHLRCQQTSITALSDARDKKNIIDIPYGLELINNLQPRQFTWDIRGETEDNPHQGTTRVGFIAQEVQTVLGEDNNVLDMVYDVNPEKLELSYGQLVPVLTKAVQELSSELIAEKEKTAILESKLTTFEARLAALEAN